MRSLTVIIDELVAAIRDARQPLAER